MKDTKRLSRKTPDRRDGLSRKTPDRRDGLSRKTPDRRDGLSQKTPDRRDGLSQKTPHQTEETIVTEDTRRKRRLSRKTPDERDDCHGRHQTEETIVTKDTRRIVTKDNSRQIQIEIVTGFTKKIHLHNKKQIVQQQGSSWAIGQCIKFRFQSDFGDGDVSE
jgi:hypothetical protein